MSFAMFERVVLTQDLPEEGLKRGDVGVIVEMHPAAEDSAAGFELEFFSASGNTIAVVSVPAVGVRKATREEVLSVRALASG